MNRLFVIVLITAFASIAKAQTTVTFQPDAVSGKGAVVDYFSSFVNDGNNPECIGENINCETRKSLIQFNLTSTPTNATLLSAALSLSAYNHLVYGGLIPGLEKLKRKLNNSYIKPAKLNILKD